MNLMEYLNVGYYFKKNHKFVKRA